MALSCRLSMKVCLICFRPESCEHLPSESPEVVTTLILERNLDWCVQNISAEECMFCDGHLLYYCSQ